MARTKKAKLDEVMQLEEFYEVTSEHKEKVVEMLNSGGIVDIHKSADKIKWRDYLYSIFKERLYTREVDQNDIIKSLRGEAIGNETNRVAIPGPWMYLLGEMKKRGFSTSRAK